MNSPVVLKLKHGDLMRRTRLREETMEALRASVSILFPSFRNFTLFYTDDEGDKIIMDSNEELKEALVLSQTTAEGRKLLRLEVVPELKRRCGDPQPTKEEKDLPSGIKMILSLDANAVRNGATIVRKIVSQSSEEECHKAFDSLVSDGAVIPRIVELLASRNQDDDLHHDLASILLNVASGKTEHTEAVRAAGAIEPLVALLRHTSVLTNKEIAVWALGNIAGDSAQSRDDVLKAAKSTLIANIMTIEDTEFLRNAAWAMMNLTRDKPAPAFEDTAAFLPCLARLLSIKKDDTTIVNDVCWALAYLTDGGDSRIQRIVECGLHVPIVPLMRHKDGSIFNPAIRTISNLMTASHPTYTQSVLDLGALEALFDILTREDMTNSTIKECFFAISNVLAGTEEQIQKVIDLDFFPLIVKFLRENDDETVQKELLFCVTNLAGCGSLEQVLLMRGLGGFRLVRGFPMSEKQEKDVALWDGCVNLFGDENEEPKPKEEVAPEGKDAKVEVLVSMGYEEDLAKAILESLGGDLFLVLEQLS
jgi:hypothetical protein